MTSSGFLAEKGKTKAVGHRRLCKPWRRAGSCGLMGSGVGNKSEGQVSSRVFS